MLTPLMLNRRIVARGDRALRIRCEPQAFVVQKEEGLFHLFSSSPPNDAPKLF
jgi:hypothetical protein